MVDTGFDFAKIRAKLDRGSWETDPEDPTCEVRRVWLGTIFGVTPSGKFYTPFACSNVAGDCKACGGSGVLTPRTGKRARARAKRRQGDYSRGTITRGGMGTPAGNAYADRVRKARLADFYAARLMCSACDGLGSRSAALDERFNTALEKEAAKIGTFVEYQDESIFISESRERLEDSDDSEEESEAASCPTS